MSEMTELSEIGREVASECACLALRKAARTVTQIYDEALRPVGLRSTQYTLLTALAIAGDAPLAAIGAHLGMDRTTLSRNLRPLQRAGLVMRAVGEPDARRLAVYLTPKGAALIRKALPRWRAAQKKVLEVLGSDAWGRVAHTLERLAPAEDRGARAD